MTHPDLFGYPESPGWQRTDTSKAAAKAVKPKAPTLRQQVLDVLADGDMTSFEIAAALRRPYASIQPRTSELREMKLIEDSGRRGVSRDPTKLAVVWTLTTENDASTGEGDA